MNIVLINAPYLDVYGTLNVGENHSFALGLGYLASVLRNDGHNVSIMEVGVYSMDKDDIRKFLEEHSPDLIGISCATANFKGATVMAKLIKEYMDVFIVLGGIHATSAPRGLLENYPQFDMLVIGEGEVTILEVCDALEKKREFKDILGIAYRGKGNVEMTESRPFVENIDELPLPARDLVDLSQYRLQVHLERGHKSVTMITSRGCPARCTFCASFKTMGYAYRPHSPEYVLREIEELKTNYGVTHFVFLDDTFTFDVKRAQAICQGIIDKKLDIEWHCFARVKPVSRELLTLMKKSGCIGILFGVEAANLQILKNIKKGTKPDDARKAMRLSNELGIKTIASFIFGNPGETHATIEETIDFAIELKPTIASFNRLVPFPGTEIYEKFYKEKYQDGKHWDDFVPKAAVPVAELEGVSKKDLQRYTNLAFRRFYFRFSQLFRILRSIKTYGEFKAYLRGGLGLLRQMRVWKKTTILD